MSSQGKRILDIILEEVIRSIFVIGIPVAINHFRNISRKEITDNRQTVKNLKDTFTTDHDWKFKN